jgi:hypothetical protein
LAMIPEVSVQVSIWNGLVRYYKDQYWNVPVRS